MEFLLKTPYRNECSVLELCLIYTAGFSFTYMLAGSLTSRMLPPIGKQVGCFPQLNNQFIVNQLYSVVKNSKTVLSNIAISSHTTNGYGNTVTVIEDLDLIIFGFSRQGFSV